MAGWCNGGMRDHYGMMNWMMGWWGGGMIPIVAGVHF